jgi:hypothetical protein
MLKADMPAFQIAKLWMDVATLEERVVQLEFMEPPGVVIERALDRLCDIHCELQPLKSMEADTHAYRCAMYLVEEQLRIVALLLNVWRKDRP